MEASTESKSSDSAASSGRSDHPIPRAVVHKKILDVAESRPDASLEEIADEVSGATVSIVEQVLEEYGDPGRSDDPEDGADSSTASDPAGDDVAADASTADAELESGGESELDSSSDRNLDSEADSAIDAGTEDGSEDDTDGETIATTESDDTADAALELSIEPSDVTEKQLETFRAIDDSPDATQAELADRLGVSSATISQRVNAVEGFDWSERRAFVEALFDDETEPEGAGPNSNHGERETDGGTESESKPELESEAPPRERTGDERTEDEHIDCERTEDETVETNPHTTDENRSGPNDVSSGDGDLGTRDSLASERIASDDRAPVADLTRQVRRLTERLETLEDALAEIATAGVDADTGPGVASDPELAHNVIRACFADDRISEEEELRILKLLMAPDFDSS